MSVHHYTDHPPAAERTPWSRITHRDSLARRLDWPLLLATAALTLLGILLVYSATRGRTDLHDGDPRHFLMRHTLNACIGAGLAWLVLRLGHRRLRDAVPVLYAASVLLCVLVLTPVGAEVNGSQSWIRVGGGYAFQPAELVKVSVILAMATVLAAGGAGRPGAMGEGDVRPDSRAVLQALGLAALPSVFILLAPDVGTTMVIAAITLGALLAAGAPRGWIAGLIAVGVAGALAVWQLGLLDEYQLDRFAAFANPALDPMGVGYNTNQARIAIGSGGLTGQGLFHGGQTTGQFVPEQHTDFIFTVAGEELGFVGAGSVIVLTGVVLWRGCRIALHAPDLYGTVVAAGIVTWIAFQAFENMGMALGIMPVTGLPLPFLSYGGSSMFAVWIAVGLLLAIRVDARTRP